MDIDAYNHIRSGGVGFYEQKRGLIAVWGKEAVPFLDGMITNDMKTLADWQQMLAAFPNAQGRLLAVVRVLREGERFLIETDEATREKVFNNLFRFTYAGDFFVEDLSDNFKYFDLFGSQAEPPASAGAVTFNDNSAVGHFVPVDVAEAFREQLSNGGGVAISNELYETLRIESGTPKYGVDMDETTIVPELGLDGLISYNKGCYIGQEIVARIHFRGHVAKQLTGLILPEPPTSAGGFQPGAELTSPDGKNAGRVTSAAFSKSLEQTVGLGYVRYDYLAAGTQLLLGETKVVVADLPFVN